jgi:NAD(P)-dependent dehydrogenase (short-subunit alcohol dehydrogenase family)
MSTSNYRFYYRDKIVLITGATSGIGRALGESLCGAGAHVVFSGRRAQLAGDIAAAVQRDGGRAEALRLDVTDAAAVEQAVEDICRRHGRLDLLFNNAGMGIAGEVADLQLEHWQKVIDVDLLGVLHAMLPAYRAMIGQGHGQIVNVASLAGLIGYPTNTPYAAVKSALVTMSQCLRIEAEAYGVKVNVVCPGFVESEIFDVTPVVGANRTQLNQRRPFKTITAQAAAHTILAGVAKNRPLIIFPRYARALWWLYRFNPRLLMPIGRRLMATFRAAKSP